MLSPLQRASYRLAHYRKGDDNDVIFAPHSTYPDLLLCSKHTMCNSYVCPEVLCCSELPSHLCTGMNAARNDLYKQGFCRREPNTIESEEFSFGEFSYTSKAARIIAWN